MKYVNDRFYELMNAEGWNQELIQEMKKEVDEFLPCFSDSPDRLSRWGHYYFCDDDGGRLIFDLNSPGRHRCEVCGKVFESEILDGVWVYFYRNKAVIMEVVDCSGTACIQQRFRVYDSAEPGIVKNRYYYCGNVCHCSCRFFA